MNTIEVRSEYVRLAGGALAHFSAAGESGPAVVLLHGGLPGSSGSAGWSKVLPELAARGVRVFAPDLPGFGRADTRPEHHPVLGLKSWVDFVREFVDALGLDEFYLAGNSQGAQIGACFTTSHFERVRGLVMISTAGLSECIGIDWPFRERGDWPPRFEGTEESMRTVLEHVVRFKENLTDELVAGRTAAAAVQSESYAAGVASRNSAASENFRQWMDLSDRLPRLTLPMIYLYGCQDRLLPAEGVNIQEDALPNVQFFYIEECGHQVQTDQAEIVNDVIGEFILDGRISAGTAARAGISTRRAPLPGIIAGEPAHAGI